MEILVNLTDISKVCILKLYARCKTVVWLSIDIMIFRYCLPILLDSEIYHETSKRARESVGYRFITDTLYSKLRELRSWYPEFFAPTGFAWNLCVRSSFFEQISAIYRKEDKAVVIVTIDVTIDNNAGIYLRP